MKRTMFIIEAEGDPADMEKFIEQALRISGWAGAKVSLARTTNQRKEANEPGNQPIREVRNPHHPQ